MRLSLCSFLFLLGMSVGCRLSAQDQQLIPALVQRIAAQQIIAGKGVSAGNFPSFISNSPILKTTKNDDNVFFAALINYILLSLYQQLPDSSQAVVKSIREHAVELYPKFRNQRGRLTYNFWRTDTAFIFPYTRWIHRFKKNTSLPDDLDDTVLSLLAQNSDSADAVFAHELMQDYVNDGSAKSIVNEYRNFPAYSVWYGKRFPPVFDVCVLSNVLSFVQHYKLHWTSADLASLDVILKAIDNGDYIRRPMRVSPYYGSTTLILYHLARLMSQQSIPQLEVYKTQLIVTAVNAFAQSDDLLERVMLCTAIIKWGYVPPTIQLPGNDEAIEQVEHSNLAFFTGNIPSYFSPLLKQLFTQKGWLLFYHYCPAFNDALLLEYMVLLQSLHAND